MHEFKGAIFDMDGTLLDSMPVWKRLTQGYLSGFGVTVTDEEYAACEGFSQPQVAQYFADRYPDLPLDAQGIMKGMDALITARYETLAKPKDGVIAFLDGLRRRGVKMAIATLTARRHAEKALRERDMMDYFDFMLTIEDVGISKREPDIYLKSAEKLGLAPADCIVFEDAPYACATAKRAGFRVCGMVEPAYAAGENELRSVSDFVVEQSFDELRGKL
nr:HAD family phosphatase [uncultured Agathobaculum sp.]